MGEVDLRLRRQPVEQARRPCDRQVIPTHVRNLDRTANAHATALEQAQAGSVRRFLAAFEQELHAEANPQQRRAAAHRVTYGIPPTGAYRGRGAEMAYTRNDDARGAIQLGGTGRREVLGAAGGQGLAHGREIAGAVIDQGDHSRPFVDGSIRPSCLSFEQATRRARAKALNTASIWW